MPWTDVDATASSEAGDLLTTGQAAAMLGSSRQHVVDLCERGGLPFTTTGKQRRSLWLAYAVAARIVEDPETAVAVATTNLRRMRGAVRGPARHWLDEWERLLHGPLDELLDSLTSRSPKGRELRQNSPFAGLLGEEERHRLLEAWRSDEASGRG